MINMGDILSTVGEYHDKYGGYHEYRGGGGGYLEYCRGLS